MKIHYKKIKAYTKLGIYYDEIIAPDYDEFVQFFMKIKQKFNLDYSSVLDIGCGNGKLTQLFQSKTLGEFHGIDKSSEMIHLCQSTLKNITFECQDILSFKSKQQFSFIYFLNTGINYILSMRKIKKIFKQVYSLLQKDSAFFFDMSSEKNFIDNYTKEVQFGEITNGEYLIKSVYNNNSGIGTVSFQFLEKRENGNRFYIEKHKLKIFKLDDMVDILKSIFTDVIIFYDFGESQTEFESDNFSFLCRK